MNPGVPITISVVGMKEVARDLGLVGLQMSNTIDRGVSRIADVARSRLIIYPPINEGNRPKPYPGKWYVRGYGPMWSTKSGTVHGRRTSEQLGRSWRKKRTKPMERVVDTPVSYAPYVMGHGSQSAVHARHGWNTESFVADQIQESGMAQKIILAEIDATLRRAGL